MNKSEFGKLINNDLYQIFLFTCPATIPFQFAVHPWFVCNKQGKITRYEIKSFKDKSNNTHLHINHRPPYKGVETIPYNDKYLWASALIGIAEGDSKSYIPDMIDFIENTPHTYPYLHQYKIIGPNSNTYIQWVLDHFPQTTIKLPINAWGKGYKKQKRFV